MTTAKAIDGSTPLTALSASAIAKAGYISVLRYLGHWSKSLTPREPPIIHNAGLNLGLIYEGNPTSVQDFTIAQAKSDVANAVTSAKYLGAPAGVGICFAVDYDAVVHDLEEIVAYFGVIIARIGPYKPGAYGDDIVLDALYRTYGDKLFYWQTSAWSAGARFPHAALYQGTYNQSVGGVACDIDEVLGNPFWWAPTTNSGGGNVAQPTLRLTNPYTTGTAVKTLQTDLNEHGTNPKLTVDGVFGPLTETAVKAFQKANGLTEDGIVGPLTWAALDKPVSPPPQATPSPAPSPAPATHDYKIVVDQPDKAICGQWVPIHVHTFDGDKALPNQKFSMEFTAPGEAQSGVTDASTGASNDYFWMITDSNAKTMTNTVTWTGPSGKLQTLVKTTEFSLPVTTPPVLPSEDASVAIVPVVFMNDAVNFELNTVDGKQIDMILDTGAFELMFNKAAADLLGLKDPGGAADITISGVTGNSKAYMTGATFVIGGVKFTDVPCVVDPEAQMNLFGYRFFQDNHYDLLVSQKHNCFVVMK